jgi:hypothetical protein
MIYPCNATGYEALTPPAEVCRNPGNYIFSNLDQNNAGHVLRECCRSNMSLCNVVKAMGYMCFVYVIELVALSIPAHTRHRSVIAREST